MSRATAVRWGLATAAFLAIGLVSMRWGHTVALGLLVAGLVGVFALDLAAKRRERSAAGPGTGPGPSRETDPAIPSPGDGTPTSGSR